MIGWLLRVEVANWKVVAFLIACCLVAFSLAGFRRRGRLLLVGAGVLLGVTATADVVNTYYGYLPQVADVVGVTDWPVIPTSFVEGANHAGPVELSAMTRSVGGVVTIKVTGARSRVGSRKVYVYLPPQYFSHVAARFPVVYLLHGSPGRPEDWLRAGRAASAGAAVAAAGRPVVLVMPPMSHGWLDDSECVDGRHGSWETWLTGDVVPAIDAAFRTVPTRNERALAGMSAGGFCALNLSIRHSGQFGQALDMSGYTSPTHSGGMRSLFGGQWRSQVAASTPAEFIASHRLELPLSLRFDVGTADGAPRRQFARLEPDLIAHGVSVVVVDRPGTHTYHVWVPALRSGLDWFSREFYPNTPERGPARTT